MLWNALLPNKLITRSYIDMKQVSSLFSYVYINSVSRLLVFHLTH